MYADRKYLITHIMRPHCPHMPKVSGNSNNIPYLHQFLEANIAKRGSQTSLDSHFGCFFFEDFLNPQIFNSVILRYHQAGPDGQVKKMTK